MFLKSVLHFQQWRVGKNTNEINEAALWIILNCLLVENNLIVVKERNTRWKSSQDQGQYEVRLLIVEWKIVVLLTIFRSTIIFLFIYFFFLNCWSKTRDRKSLCTQVEPYVNVYVWRARAQWLCFLTLRVKIVRNVTCIIIKSTCSSSQSVF